MRQPQAMLAYAMPKQGVDLAQVKAVNAGATVNMMATWRQGQGDYFHEQEPYPQQLEYEQVASIVASVGEVLGPVAFSSLTVTREWLQKPEARRFMRAYGKAREWVNTASAVEIARAEQGFCPDVDQRVLTPPDIGERSAPFEHQPLQVGEGVKDALHATPQPLCCPEVLRATPQEPTVLSVEGEVGLHADIDGQQHGYGVDPPQRSRPLSPSTSRQSQG